MDTVYFVIFLTVFSLGFVTLFALTHALSRNRRGRDAYWPFGEFGSSDPGNSHTVTGHHQHGSQPDVHSHGHHHHTGAASHSHHHDTGGYSGDSGGHHGGGFDGGGHHH